MIHACPDGRHPDPHWHCYSHCRCHCPRCTTLINVYKQQLKSRHARGETVSVDRRIVHDHLAALIDRYGLSRMAIARAAGYGNVTTVTSALDLTITRPVPASAAARLLAVSWDTLDDEAKVHGRYARTALDRLDAAGWSRHQVALGLGWSSWPGQSWPRGRVTRGLVRRLEALAAEAERPRCLDCGAVTFAGGLRCWPCFKANAKPMPATGCGTDAGYTAHRRRGEPPCQACREAHSGAWQTRKEAC